MNMQKIDQSFYMDPDEQHTNRDVLTFPFGNVSKKLLKQKKTASS